MPITENNDFFAYQETTIEDEKEFHNTPIDNSKELNLLESQIDKYLKKHPYEREINT